MLAAGCIPILVRLLVLPTVAAATDESAVSLYTAGAKEKKGLKK